jgi:hypothetical protein
MMRAFCLMPLFAICLGMQTASPQTGPKVEALCSMQQTVRQGDHMSVRVSGVFTGLELGTLQDPNCPNEYTWVELDLTSEKNKEKLRTVLEGSDRADVVFEGVFYGPPVPDPKLPEGLRKAYHPGWGHLGAFRTKLLVHQIAAVKLALPDDK